MKFLRDGIPFDFDADQDHDQDLGIFNGILPLRIAAVVRILPWRSQEFNNRRQSSALYLPSGPRSKVSS